ncbi:hypothetical protein LL033_17490 [Clostridium estertheticum]|uniref:hypothetical protein n=1 Tax=Clostridium estertheticum TaxID=238834 RepID=UPI001C0C088B|nr:hypothetical protein [Clostridium estertheticum]MBU3216637.1 hypothetical protein [Clostridium estertheticum]WAG54408.1 hypothetical protein LL033_17490 [Clostridium estertheticum]
MESECNICINQQRIDYLEKGYEELKEGSKVTNNNVALIITNNSENRIHFEQIFDSLKSIAVNLTKVTESLESNSKETVKTEYAVETLKLTTDKLTIDVKEANTQIGLIQEAPLKSYNALKNTAYGCVISAVIGGLVVHFLPIILLLL